ncbi:hypothetical protein [Clostridium sp. AT4]|jgi:hypothetical protein|uniref:hypothetical protein n=1 Tax=Clostridium sp. AT4 TaxID=1720194 RepID=UPI000833E81E|nr:hypothetical protein [Clostridium sp. AT4]
MIRRLIENIQDAYLASDWKTFAKYCFILVPPIIVVIIGAVLLVNFIMKNFDAFMIATAAIIAVVGFSTQSKSVAKKAETPATKNAGNNILFFNKILLRNIFLIFKENHRAFHVIPPTTFGDLKDDLGSQYEPSKGCSVYRFKIMSDGAALEENLFSEILTSKLESKLADGSMNLGRATVEYHNRLYPRIFVDEVILVSGAWHISLVIVDTPEAANYIDTKENTAYMYHNAQQLKVFDDDF